MNQDINIKIMKKPELTDEEIHSHMHFDRLLEAYKVTGPDRSYGKWFYTAGYVVSAVLLISTVFYFFLSRSNKANDHDPQPSHASGLDSSTQIKNHVVNQSTPKIESQEKKVIATHPNILAKKKEKDSTTLIDSSKRTASSQFTEAEPIDGYSALYEYFDCELKYPIDAVGGSAEGIVTVSFAIDQNGKPSLIKIENSLGAPFDKECQRVINLMPKWKPATINGKPISTRLSIPLTFKIKK